MADDGTNGEQLLALDLMRAGWELAYVDAVVTRHYPSRQRVLSVRSRLIERNRLWVTWLRRPLGTVVGQTQRALWQTANDRTARSALLEALQGLPWVVRERRPIPAWIEQQLRQVELAERCFERHRS